MSLSEGLLLTGTALGLIGLPVAALGLLQLARVRALASRRRESWRP